MNKMLSFFSASIVVHILFSCQTGIRFNADEWKNKDLDWWLTAKREKMVNDLVQSDTLKGMNKKQVIALLGMPETADKSTLQYLIREKYSNDIDPDYTSYLVIEFDESGLVKQFKTVVYENE